MQYKVYILLSCFNGHRFLVEQVQSILNQTHKNLNLIIRDDGSKDPETLRILKYFQSYENIEVLFGENVGLPAAFFSVLSEAPRDGDYYFFADQDDVWMPQKVEMALRKIEELEEPYRLYVSRTILVDENLVEIGLSSPLPSNPKYQQALVGNIATGCTMGFSHDLFSLILDKTPRMDRIYLHDWWFYLVAVFLGKVCVDNEAYIWYRQHSSNSVGMTSDFFSKNLFRVKRIFRKDAKFTMATVQVTEFYELYKDILSEDKKAFLADFIERNSTIFSRFLYLFRSNIIGNSQRSTKLIKILIFFGFVK